MIFEELISSARKVKAPDLDTSHKFDNQASDNMRSLVDKLKKVDLKTKLSIRVLQILYLIMMVVFSYYMLTAELAMVRTGLGLIIGAFLLVILVQQLRYLAYVNSYDDRPVLESLYNAKSRMKVFTKRTWLVIPIWILIDVGLCFILAAKFPFQNYADDIIIILQVILIALISLDFYVAYLEWKRNHKPVLDEIDKIIKEIETV